MNTPRTHIVHHHSGHGHWDIVLRAPDPCLVAYVRHYQGYVAGTKAPHAPAGTPSGDVVLIVTLGPGLRSLDPRNPAVTTEFHNGFVAGLHDSYALIETAGNQQGVEVRFTPIGAHLVFGLPMHTLANRTVALDDILGPLARQVTEQLHEAPNWESRFAILDAVISTRLAQARAPSTTPAVTWAWNQLRASNGHLTIGTLATELGWSRKHLIAQFHEQIGLPPKVVARILRFRHAVCLLDRDNKMNWGQIAHDCGYYDQAHLIRDFRQFSGSAPGEFLRHRLLERSSAAGDEIGRPPVTSVQDTSPYIRYSLPRVLRSIAFERRNPCRGTHREGYQTSSHSCVIRMPPSRLNGSAGPSDSRSSWSCRGRMEPSATPS